ncbi:hypothetical protein DFR74_101637 [Nocardia puris]|uniref:Uncharacterized protein n=1 Tax=Nocardia puris TaxID=208602 RepID=A0A366E2M3_9NOCA|nr:hypothetical protein DFR74_101637 [Nocardia puris]
MYGRGGVVGGVGAVWHDSAVPIRLPHPPRAGFRSGSRADRHTSGGRVVIVRDEFACAAAEPTRHSVFDRRTAFRVAGAGAVGALAVGAVAGCTDDTIHDPDPLAAQEITARADAAAATAAIALAPERHAALTAIAAERTAHADALRDEVARVIGVYGDGTTPVHRTRELTPVSAAASPGATGAPVAPAGVDELRARLTSSRDSAAQLAATLSGYRSGLLASISAACAAHAEVLLA